jgi:hypothetical protein
MSALSAFYGTAVNYTCELAVDAKGIKPETVESGKHREWRLTLEEILLQIPEVDRKRIRVAREMEVMWKPESAVPSSWIKFRLPEVVTLK